MTGDSQRSEQQIYGQIAGQMLAALVHLDHEIDKIMVESGFTWEEDEWLEEVPGT